ncbi:uncharacterized protein LOC121384201 [Gigantopelta aegis]|uniref:uncharacterized protein LOC121384201 n=1 Tax=Gigantopelta aegis TaxID=1735272 RepID=UPI001B88DB04|nr:uncharacterized protein LOC121384201 [Gigantopelta aegis]
MMSATNDSTLDPNNLVLKTAANKDSKLNHSSNNLTLETAMNSESTFHLGNNVTLGTPNETGGLLQALNKPQCVEFQRVSVLKSADVRDTSPSSSNDQSVTSQDCVYTSVTLLTDLDSASQPRSAGVNQTQADYGYDSCGAISPASQAGLQVTNSVLTVPLTSSGCHELIQSEQIMQDVLPQGYQSATPSDLQYIPTSTQSLSVSSLPLVQASTGTLDSGAYCANVTVPSGASVCQQDDVPSSVSFSQQDVVPSNVSFSHQTVAPSSVSFCHQTVVPSNVSFSQQDIVPSSVSFSRQDIPSSVSFCHQNVVPSSVSFSQQDVVPSSVSFTPQETVFEVNVPQRVAVVPQNMKDPRLQVLETVTSMYSFPAFSERAQDDLSYPYMTCASGDVAQPETVPSGMLPNVVEPAVGASCPSSDVGMSTHDYNTQDSVYYSMTNADMAQNFSVSACENAVISCPEPGMGDGMLTNPSVFMGNTALDNSFNELIVKSNNPEMEYFDICSFMSSPDNSPVKKTANCNTVSTHSNTNPQDITTDADHLLYNLKRDHPKDQMPKSIVSPSVPKVFISPSVNPNTIKMIVTKKTKPKSGKRNCRYVKPVCGFLNKANVKMMGKLKPFCECIEKPDQSLVLKEQTIFTYGRQVLLPQIHRIACCGFELIAVHRGYMMFVCIKQLFSFGLVDRMFYKSVQKHFPEHVDIMTPEEVLFVEHHTKMSSCRGLISLDRLVVALSNLPSCRKEALMDDDMTFYEICPGHWCEKRRKLIRCVSDLEKRAAVFQKTTNKIQEKKCMKMKTQADSKILVDRPDGAGYCLAEVKTVLVANKELMSFSWLDDTYINCLQLCQYLADFPWVDFLELAKSLNIDFLDAPEEVQTHLKKQGHCNDIVAGKWTSVANLRLISCFAVGQMNHTDFLIKNSVLTKIAKGDFIEISEKPTDILKMAASEIRDSVQTDEGNLAEYEKPKVRKSSKKSFKNVLDDLDATQLFSRARKERNTKAKKVRKKVCSSQTSLSSTEQAGSGSCEKQDMAINCTRGGSNGSYISVNKGDFVRTTDCNENVVFVENSEGVFFECIPLYTKMAEPGKMFCEKSDTRLDSVSSADVNTKNSLSQPPLTLNDHLRSLSSVDESRYPALVGESAHVNSSSSDLASVDFDFLVRTPQPFTESSDNETKSPSRRMATSSSVPTSEDIFKSPDSGISLDIQSVMNTACLVHEDQHVGKSTMNVPCEERLPDSVGLESVGLESVEHNCILQQSPDLALKQQTPPAKTHSFQSLSDTEYENWRKGKQADGQTEQQNIPPMYKTCNMSSLSDTECETRNKDKLFNSRFTLIQNVPSSENSKDVSLSSILGHAPQQSHVNHRVMCSKNSKDVSTDFVKIISDRSPSKETSLEAVALQETHVEFNQMMRESGHSEKALGHVAESDGCKISKPKPIDHTDRIPSAFKTKQCETSRESEYEHLQFDGTSTSGEISTIQAIPCFKRQELVTVFKQLLPMINITDMVHKDNRLKFHLSLGPSIKQMLTKSGQEVSNVHRFLKIVGRLVLRAQQYVESQADVVSVLARTKACSRNPSSPQLGHLQSSDLPESHSRDISKSSRRTVNMASNKMAAAAADSVKVAAFSTSPAVGEHRTQQVHTVNNTPVMESEQTSSKSDTANEARKTASISAGGSKLFSKAGTFPSMRGGQPFIRVSASISDLCPALLNSSDNGGRKSVMSESTGVSHFGTCKERSSGGKSDVATNNDDHHRQKKTPAVVTVFGTEQQKVRPSTPRHCLSESPTIPEIEYFFSKKNNSSVSSVSVVVKKVQKKRRTIRKILDDPEKGATVKSALKTDKVEKGAKRAVKFKRQGKNATNSFVMVQNSEITMGQAENTVVKRKRGRPRKNANLIPNTKPSKNVSMVPITEPINNASVVPSICVDAAQEDASVLDWTSTGIGPVSDFVTYPDPLSSTGQLNDLQTVNCTGAAQVFVPPVVLQQSCQYDSSLVYTQIGYEASALFVASKDCGVDSINPIGHQLSSTSNPRNTKTKQKVSLKRKHFEGKCAGNDVGKRKKF